MYEVINKIVDIEQEAQKIDGECEKLTHDFPSRLDNEIEKLKQQFEDEIAEKINELAKNTAIEKEKVSKGYEAEFAKKLANLNDKYQKNHIEWENDIIKRVLI